MTKQCNKSCLHLAWKQGEGGSGRSVPPSLANRAETSTQNAPGVSKSVPALAGLCAPALGTRGQESPSPGLGLSRPGERGHVALKPRPSLPPGQNGRLKQKCHRFNSRRHFYVLAIISDCAVPLTFSVVQTQQRAVAELSPR